MNPKYRATRFGSHPISRGLYFIGGILGFALIASLWKMPDVTFVRATIIVVIAFVLSLVTGGLGFLLDRYSRPRNQERRDRRAQVILDQARQGSCGDYSLYLRAFETTGRMGHDAVASNMGVQADMDPRWHEARHVDLETELAKAVEASVPLVALGRPGEQEGAGRIVTDDKHWKDDVDILARRAKVIFIIPYNRPGTLWEIEYLLNKNILKKALFIMPPEKETTEAFSSQKIGELSWSQIWLELLHKNNRINLPEYDERGAVFCLKEDGSINLYCHMEYGLGELRRYLTWILSALSNPDKPVRWPVQQGPKLIS